MRNAIIGIVVICAAAIAGLTFLGPVIGGPDYVSPIDFSDEAQVKRRVNEYFDGFQDFQFSPDMTDMSAILGPDSNTELPDFGTSAQEFMQYYYDSHAEAGFDYQQMFDAMVANLECTVEEVEVDGDTARCLVRISQPDLNAIGNSYSSDEFSSLGNEEIMADVTGKLADPSTPRETGEYWLVLDKTNGAWDFDFLSEDSEYWPFAYFFNTTNWLDGMANLI